MKLHLIYIVLYKVQGTCTQQVYICTCFQLNNTYPFLVTNISFSLELSVRLSDDIMIALKVDFGNILIFIILYEDSVTINNIKARNDVYVLNGRIILLILIGAW